MYFSWCGMIRRMPSNKNKIFILYARDRNRCGMAIREMMTDLVPKGKIEVYNSIPGLTAKLRTPQRESTIAVLFVADGEDLESILAVQSFFGNTPIVLILPDRKADTIMKGHSMHPRYLSFKDNRLEDVRAVLARMIRIERTVKEIRPEGL
jgi:hypothetical protein